MPKKKAVKKTAVPSNIECLKIHYPDIGTVEFSDSTFSWEDGPYPCTPDEMIEVMQDVKRLIQLVEVG